MNDYRGAVLIIGSLWWDPLDIRVNWRNDRLDLDNGKKVYAPIRYGKLSTKRGDTYTMVFSQLCHRKDYGLGTALTIPFKHPVKSADDLIKEAADLWKAERELLENNSLEISRKWGVVGLKVRPGVKFPDAITRGWVSHYTRQSVKFQNAQSNTEKPVIDENGFLNIRWLVDFEKNLPIEFDFILATATQPTLTDGRYPTTRAIAKAWKNDKDDNVKYFWNNQKHGITTFQDDGIIRFLEVRNN